MKNILKYIFIIEWLYHSMADILYFRWNRFDKRKIKKLSHNSSFVLPWLSLWESDWSTYHSLKLTNQNSIFSEGFLILDLIKLFSQLWINNLYIRSLYEIANYNIILSPFIFELIMAIIVKFSAIKSYCSKFCIKRGKSKIQNFPIIFKKLLVIIIK